MKRAIIVAIVGLSFSLSAAQQAVAGICLGDASGDGIVDAFDLGALLGSWGPCDTVCPADFNFDGTVDAFDLGALLGNWGFCNCPGTGDCCVENGTLGCENEECCQLVCALDDYCCFSAWDGLCAQAAREFCDLCACDIECPPVAAPEPEPCGEDTNGGCNSEPPVFTQAECGDLWCGTTWADGTRDTDWYLVGTGGGVLAASLQSEVPSVLFIVDGIATCTPVVAGDIGCSQDCGATVPAVADLPPGEYVVFVAPGECTGGGIFEGYPCSLFNEYVVQIECLDPACGPMAGSCCGPTGTPGCSLPDCCSCICDCDPFCCTVEWDEFCSGAGEFANCGAANPDGPCVEACAPCQCGNGVVQPGIGEDCDPPDGLFCRDDCRFGPCNPTAGNCCLDSGTPGCEDPLCCECICTNDSFCCETSWDSLCAQQAAMADGVCDTECLVCPFSDVCGPDAGGCCASNGSPGCNVLDCCVTVCSTDAFCCDTTWDSICGGLAVDLCGDLCP